MIDIPEHTVSELIYKDAKRLVLRAVKHSDKSSVIVKTTSYEFPPSGEISRLKHEYEILRKLRSCPRIIQAREFKEIGERPVLVFEDFKGSSLDKLSQRPAPVEFVLNLGLKLADILGALHKKEITHKNIHPGNIVWNAETEEAELIDFCLASASPLDRRTSSKTDRLEGRLTHISPEQTGRMNRGVDYRTDFYSLGVTLYELSTGRLPFKTERSLELIHCHIAQEPVPPRQINGAIPEALSDIVLKLMSKEADDRYQGSYGLGKDLERCLNDFKKKGSVECFPLGKHDVPRHFKMSRKLYGRDEEIAFLRDVFDSAAENNKEMVLVSGFSGVGKSSLIYEFRKSVAPLGKGCFIIGKFDQYHRGIPHQGIIQAFSDLIRQILGKSSEQLERVKKTLLEAIGPNGAIITDVVPDMKFIMGEQPPVPELGPEEAKNRFNMVFENFIGAFAELDPPLTIFLDDLQWCDSSSLHLIERIMTSAVPHSIFFIGAYRDNEVDADHLLSISVNEIEKTKKTRRLSLEPLFFSMVEEILADTLKSARDEIGFLAKTIHAKTGGNPFYTEELLQYLVHNSLLFFNFDLGKWDWDIDEIGALEISENVIDLVLDRFGKLTEKERETLSLAACIGGAFDLKILSLISEKTPGEVNKRLRKIIRDGIVFHAEKEKYYDPLANNEEFDAKIMEGSLSMDFYFHHDKLREGAYLLISDERRKTVHKRIGELLLKHSSPSEKKDNILGIVNQFNLGIDLITLQSQRKELAKLNLAASKKAKASNAHKSALDYLTVGLELLEKDAWEKEYDLTLALHTEAAEAACLAGEFEKVEELSETALEQTKDLLDKIRIYEIRIQTCLAQNNLSDALDTALKTLRILGINFPPTPGKSHVLIELLKTKLTLFGKNTEELIDLPQMTDPRKLSAMRIMVLLALFLHSMNMNLCALFILKSVRLSIQYGNNYLSPCLAYAGYGLISCGVLDDFNAGYRFGQLALNLADRINIKNTKTTTIISVNALIQHWKAHIRETLRPLLDGYQSGVENGDFTNAAQCLQVYVTHSYFAGIKLKPLDQKISSYVEIIRRLKQQRPLNGIRTERRVARNLMGFTENPLELTGEDYNEEEMVLIYQRENDQAGLCGIYIHKLILSYLFGEREKSVENVKKVEEYSDSLMGSIDSVIFNFYQSLALLALFSVSSKKKRKKILKNVEANQAKMKKWARHAPMNHSHKFQLVEAERFRVLGKRAKAAECYDKAISLAEENGFLNELALANELAGKFYLEKGALTVARAYLENARHCYGEWGAEAKVRHLDEKHPRLLENILALERARSENRKPEPTRDGKRSDWEEDIDLASVMKAARAISGEIRIESLLEKLMSVIIENAGAQKGFLLFPENGKLMIKARIGVKEEFSLESVDLDQSDELPKTVAQYVFRAGEMVLLSDASNEGNFSDDPVVSRRGLKSILCFPVVRLKELVCLLYIENNLTTDAFTPSRLEIIRIFASQMAISLENAQLFAKLQKSLEVKDEFLANTSHELRTPLHGIIGISEALMAGDRRFLKSELLPGLKTIALNGRRLSNMVNDLLDYSKMRHHNITLSARPLNLWEIVEEVVYLNSPLAERKNIALENKVKPDLLAAEADEDRLRQILNNLINNAVKFTERGGVAVSAGIKSDKMEISVTDTGIGIPKEKITKIFEPFEQGDGSIERKYGGTGIGLSITKKLTELHGGRIWAESEPGQGSRFFFTLPVSDKTPEPARQLPCVSRTLPPIAEEDSPERREEPAPKKGFYKILAVDDDPANLQTLSYYLDGGQYSLAAALSGEEALSIIEKEEDFNLVLLDVMMPKMSGFEVCRLIREKWPANKMPILFLTARNQVSSLVEGFEAGGNDYLPKPFSRKELIARIEFHLKLSNATKELFALRTFSNQIGVFAGKVEMAEAAFDQIIKVMPSSSAYLLRENKMVKKYAQGNSAVDDPPFQPEILAIEQSPTIIDSTNSKAGSSDSGNLLYFHMDEIRFYFYRRPEFSKFSCHDMEYIKTFLHEMKLIRKNIHAVIFRTNPNILQKLIRIQMEIDRVLYLTVDKPDTVVVFTDPKKKELSFRLSLEKVEMFFEEETFVRAHRSFLVNRSLVNRAVPSDRASSGHALKFYDREIPIGGSYINYLRKKCPEWFK